jgi:GTP:adenosylcobinamide-phosphate guanylyltransferase
VSADLPLLNPNTIKKIINLCAAFDVACISVVLEKYFVKNLGIEPSIVFNIGKKEYCHSGIAIVDSSQFKSQDDLDEYYVVMNEKEIAVNVNTPMELNLAEKLIYNN